MCKIFHAELGKTKFKWICKGKYQEAEHFNLLEVEKDNCKNVHENLKLAMKKVG